MNLPSTTSQLMGEILCNTHYPRKDSASHKTDMAREALLSSYMVGLEIGPITIGLPHNWKNMRTLSSPTFPALLTATIKREMECAQRDYKSGLITEMRLCSSLLDLAPICTRIAKRIWLFAVRSDNIGAHPKTART
jgi:hypothetical protein